MIRHAFFRCGLRCGEGLAPPVSALAVAVIEAAFFGLLMATIGDAVFSAAGEFATEFADLCFGNGVSKEKPRLLQQPGFIFSSRIKMLTKGET